MPLNGGTSEERHERQRAGMAQKDTKMNHFWDDEETQSEAQMHTQAIEAGWSSTEDPETCACRGTGYILSQLDTFHECRIHFVKGQPHPEDDENEDDREGRADYEAELNEDTYERDMEREAERAYERQAEEACERLYGGCE